MRIRPLVFLCAAAVWIAVLGAYAWRHGHVSTDITHFLSTLEERELAAIALRLADSERTRTLILGVAAPEEATAVAAAAEWARELAAHPEVAALRAGPNPSAANAVFDLYFPRRLLFLSSRPEAELPEKLSRDGLLDAARRLRGELAPPQGPLIKEIAAADPLLAFPGQLRLLEAARGSMRVVKGSFVAGDPPRAILFLTTIHSAFDSAHQAPLLDFVASSFDALNGSHGGALRLEQSGVHRFAVASERAAKRDATWISALSMAALVASFLWIYRSLSALLLTLIPLTVGLVTATAATLALFGGLHALTVAFGSTLIGVCIDYPIHFVSHYALRRKGESSHAVLRSITPALGLAALTTVAGFLGIASSDLPGVREIGVFASLGVLAALVATVVLLPELVPRDLGSTRPLERLAETLTRIAATSPRRRRAARAFVVAILLLCAVGLPQLRWDDDVFALNMPLESEWVRESQALSDAVSQVDAGRMVIAVGDDDEAALRANDAVHERLGAARAAGALDEFRSPHALLWSRDLQERNWAALAARPNLAEDMLAVLASEGFRREAFAPFAEALHGAQPQPLLMAEIVASPLGEAIAPFRVEAEGKIALLTLLRGVRDPDAVVAALGGLPGVRYFDNESFVRTIYSRHRTRSLWLVGLGSVAMMALLLLRYRRIDRALAAGGPAILGALATAALIAASGTPLNLIHLLGLLLILSLAADYGIFLVESDGDELADASSLLSVSLAALTTLFSFGLLSLSSFPALRALGAATGIGVALSPALALCFRILRTGAARESSTEEKS